MIDPKLKTLLRCAYLDINFLLIEGFDITADECEFVSVKQTLKEIQEILGDDNNWYDTEEA